MEKFEYIEAKTFDEAVSKLSLYGQKANVLAGGTDLIPLMRNKVLKPKYVIGIAKTPSSAYIVRDDKGLGIGALTTFRDIEQSVLIQQEYPVLYEAATAMGSVQVRNMATVGGNLCRAAPGADMAPPLLVLRAEVTILGPSAQRRIPLEEFFLGPGQTALRQDEVLTEVRVPPLPRRMGSSFLKIARTSQDLAKVNVAIAVNIMDDVCEDVRIALGAVGPTPIRAKKAEEVIRGRKPEERLIEEAAKVASEEIKPRNSIRSTAEYRKMVSKVLVKRAMIKALERVK